MRRISYLITLAAFLSACNAEPTSPAELEAATNTDSVFAEEKVEIAPISLSECPASDPNRECEYDHAFAQSYYDNALAGDYQAQRNLSALHTTERPWINQQPVQGCAWRMVILASAPADSPYDDKGMHYIQCQSLGLEDQKAAQTLSAKIHQRVFGTEIGALPLLSGQ